MMTPVPVPALDPNETMDGKAFSIVDWLRLSRSARSGDVARRSARPAPCAAPPAGAVACRAKSGPSAPEVWTIDTATRATGSFFGRIANNLSCSKSSLGGPTHPAGARRADALRGAVGPSGEVRPPARGRGTPGARLIGP